MTAKLCVFAKQNTERSEVNKIRTKQRNEVKLIVLFLDVAGSSPAGGAKKNNHTPCGCSFLLGALRRGNKPLVLPGEVKKL